MRALIYDYEVRRTRSFERVIYDHLRAVVVVVVVVVVAGLIC